MSDSQVGYSANVRLFLIAQGHRLNVSHLEPNHCRVRNPVEIAPGPAELVIEIDDRQERRAIILDHGITPPSTEVEFRRG
jgi:hypothetical protein